MQLSDDYGQRVIGCEALQAVENSLSVAQSIQLIAHTKSKTYLEHESGRHRNERTAHDMLIALPQGRHSALPTAPTRERSRGCAFFHQIVSN